MAPSFIGSPRVLGAKSTLTRIGLDGLTGPIDGNEYPGGIMIPLKANNDKYIASVLTYIRNSFGNSADMITEADVAAVRRDTAGRNTPYTQEELNQIMLNADCPPSLWKISASHRAEDTKFLTDKDEKTRWWSKAEQKPGMAIEVEFPHPRNLNHIVIDANSGADFPKKLAVEFSEDGETWSKRIEADGARKIELDFEKTIARKVKISVTEPNNKWWQIQTLDISGPSEADVEKYPGDQRDYLTIKGAASFKQSWSGPKQGKSVLGQELNIAGEKFKNGIGTHSAAEFIYKLEGKGFQRFYTKCGPQGKSGKTVMTFEVYLDEQKVFESGDMQAGDPAKYLDINIVGAKQLKLVVTPGSDGKTEQDHANWVDACFISK